MKNIVLCAFLFFFQTLMLHAQSNNVSKKDLIHDLVLFLNQKGEIDESQLNDFIEGKREVEIFGTINSTKRDELINGVYTFYNSRSHHKIFQLIIENEKYTILDITSLEGIKKSLNDLIDFCERNNYCFDITTIYMNKLMTLYYNTNKNIRNRTEDKCKIGMSCSKSLP